MSIAQDPDLNSHDEGLDVGDADDIALRPGPNADAPADVERYISAEVRTPVRLALAQQKGRRLLRRRWLLLPFF